MHILNENAFLANIASGQCFGYSIISKKMYDILIYDIISSNNVFLWNILNFGVA